MSDQELLVAAVVALYLSECWAWVRRGAVLVRSNFSGRFAVAHPSSTLGNARGGWVLLNPLPPLGSAFLCHQWPLSLTKDLACSYVGQAVNFRERPVQVPRALRLDDIRGVNRSGREIVVNGSPFADLGDESLAVRFSALLADLASSPRQNRDAAIDAAFRAATDMESVRRAVERFRAYTAALRLLCCLLFSLLLVALPLSLVFGRFAELAPSLLVAAAACWLAILWRYRRAHAQLLPERRAARWRSLAIMALTPTSAIRACDAVAKELLSAFDPLAVALALCEGAEVLPFARAVLLDLRYPLLPVCPSTDPTVLDAEEEFRQRQRRRITDLARRAGLDPDALTAPPTAADPSHLSFCPRCRMQYLLSEGHCTDCGGRMLEPLAVCGVRPAQCRAGRAADDVREIRSHESDAPATCASGGLTPIADD